jgi:hypothetical protein
VHGEYEIAETQEMSTATVSLATAVSTAAARGTLWVSLSQRTIAKVGMLAAVYQQQPIRRNQSDLKLK